MAKKGLLSLIPLSDRVVVRPLTEEDLGTKTASGIIIPESVSNKEKPQYGEVIAVGRGKYENGNLIAMQVKVGDKVAFSRYGYDEIKVEGDELFILREESVLAIIK